MRYDLNENNNFIEQDIYDINDLPKGVNSYADNYNIHRKTKVQK